jgi:hypothetical protein
MSEFYYRTESGSFGPVDAATLKTLAQKGAIKSGDEICKLDDGKWFKADRVKELKIIFQQQTSDQTYVNKAITTSLPGIDAFNVESATWNPPPPPHPRGLAINPNDKRPFCLNCNAHVSPQVVGGSKNVGPTLYYDAPGDVDYIRHQSMQTRELFCTNCGDKAYPINQCKTCRCLVPVSTEYHRTSGWSWDESPMGFCLFCKSQLLGPAKSACFIATAAYGSPEEADVKSLRYFRDIYLKNNTIGRMFITAYESISPNLVPAVKENNDLRISIRFILHKVVCLLRRFRLTE